LLLAETTLSKYYIDADGPEVNLVVRKIAAGEMDQSETKKWIEEKCKRLGH
jgi:hypothetical protein